MENYNKRSRYHDYYGKFIYHIIIKKKKGAHDFGKIRGNCSIEPGQPGSAYVFLSDFGRSIVNGLRTFEDHFPEVKKFQYIIMPDHIHLILYKTVKNHIHLDDYIDLMKSLICSDYNNRRKRSLIPEQIFTEKYTDKPLYDRVVLDNWFRYLKQNPHRRAMIMQRPDFFQRVRKLIIGQETFEAFGNLFLIRNPDKIQVRVRRRFSSEEIELHRTNVLNASHSGSRIVSPFISPHEKKIREEAERGDAKIILIQYEEFGERYKPSRHDFELCTAGRLLIISLGLPKGTSLSYSISTRMNEIAATICNS